MLNILLASYIQYLFLSLQISASFHFEALGCFHSKLGFDLPFKESKLASDAVPEVQWLHSDQHIEGDSKK